MLHFACSGMWFVSKVRNILTLAYCDLMVNNLFDPFVSKAPNVLPVLSIDKVLKLRVEMVKRSFQHFDEAFSGSYEKITCR